MFYAVVAHGLCVRIGFVLIMCVICHQYVVCVCMYCCCVRFPGCCYCMRLLDCDSLCVSIGFAMLFLFVSFNRVCLCVYRVVCAVSRARTCMCLLVVFCLVCVAFCYCTSVCLVIAVCVYVFVVCPRFALCVLVYLIAFSALCLYRLGSFNGCV